MANAAPIRVDIVGNARGLSATVDLANAKLNTMAATAARASAATDRLETNLNRANAAMAAAAGVAGAGMVFKQLADSAGAAQTATNSLNAVFKGSTDQMIAAAKAGTNVGQSFSQYGANATRLGAQLQNMGFQGKAAADATQQLIQHAADLSAVFGGDATQAIEAMSAVFRKEMDPIEKYGVTMKAADIESRAAAQGITYGQAAIQAIMEQTGYAVGAFEANADTYNVQMQKMAAATENAKADMGRALLPMFGQIASGAEKVAGAIEAIPDPIQNALTQLALMGGGMKLVMIAADALTARMFAQQAAVTKTRGAWSAAAMSYGAAGAIMEKAGAAAKLLTLTSLAGWAASTVTEIDNSSAAIGEWVSQLSRAGQVTPELNGMLDDARLRFKLLADPTVADRMSAFVGSLDEVLTLGAWDDSSRNQAIAQLKEFDTQLADMAANGNAEAARDAFVKIQEGLQGTGVTYEELTALMPEYMAATEGATDATTRIATAAAATTETFKDLTAALEQVSQAQKNWQALYSGVDLIESNAAAQAAYVKALADTKTAAKDSGKALKGFTAEQITLGQASRSTKAGVSTAANALIDFAGSGLDAAKSAGDVAARMGGAEAGVRAAARATRSARSDFIQMARDMGVPKAEAKRLADQLGLIPDQVKTNFKTTGSDKAQQDARDVQSALSAIDRYIAVQVVVKRGDATPGQAGAAFENYTAPRALGLADMLTPEPRALPQGASGGGSGFAQYGADLGNELVAGLRKSLSKDVLFTGKVNLDKFNVKPVKDKLTKAQQDAFDAGGKAWDKFITRQQKAYDRLYERLRRQEENLARAREARTDWIKSAADSINAFSLSDLVADSTKVVKSWDHLDPILAEIRNTTDPERLRRLQEIHTQALQSGPKEITVATKTIGEKLREQLAKTKAFAENLRKLQAANMSEAALQEIISAGADAGGELAAALVADPALLAEYDSTYKQMADTAKGVAEALVPVGLDAEIVKWDNAVKATKKELRQFWKDFRAEANTVLKDKFKIDVEVNWKWAGSPPSGGGGRNKPGKASFDMLNIGTLIVQADSTDPETQARQTVRTLNEHLARIGR